MIRGPQRNHARTLRSPIYVYWWCDTLANEPSANEWQRECTSTLTSHVWFICGSSVRPEIIWMISPLRRSTIRMSLKWRSCNLSKLINFAFEMHLDISARSLSLFFFKTFINGKYVYKLFCGCKIYKFILE